MGRPSDYSPEIALEICEKLADGMSLRAICRDEGMPSKGTIFRWLEANPSFQDQYARARDVQADSLADDIIDIADTPLMGVKTETKGDEVKTIEGDMIEHRRLQVDARKWVAAKLKPKKYGTTVTNQNQALDRDGKPTDPVPTLADFYATVSRIPLDNSDPDDSKPESSGDV